MMRRIAVGFLLIALGATGALLAQQKYPNLPDVPVVLENDRVVVQEIPFQPGDWAGEHSHAGGQVVVVLDELKMIYREGGEEVERTFAKGDVFWVDPVTHDHKALSSGTGVLITLK